MESKIFAKLNFDPGILVILSLILTVVAIVLVIMLVLRQSRLEMNYKIFMKGKNGKTLEDTFKAQFDDIDLVKEQTDLLHKRMMYVEKSLNRSYQKCGVVKYDAFKELGGQLSFAYALLNDSNTGFVMNCIHSREGSYTYIKDIVRGECELPLSEEEAEAVKNAIASNSPQPTTLLPEARKFEKSTNQRHSLKRRLRKKKLLLRRNLLLSQPRKKMNKTLATKKILNQMRLRIFLRLLMTTFMCIKILF